MAKKDQEPRENAPKKKSGKSALMKQELMDRSDSFSKKKTNRKHPAPKTSRNPKGFS
ncbi:hypothetical protein H8S90_11675 [Olivibacter sp. SDN3]|uniref:hypothetical protein n=1 Tax=Olivibacter sp. SDN3 TaxID=2764720 RepID=UPI00165100CE|nr:hypothetical protein [Olivibacter sp. SDN3]QNL52174.1 hypothetical protein H8S90_11675 [Olivibacter sp. SDN3]